MTGSSAATAATVVDEEDEDDEVVGVTSVRKPIVTRLPLPPVFPPAGVHPMAEGVPVHSMIPFTNALGSVNTAPLSVAPVKPDRIDQVHAPPLDESVIVAGPPMPGPRIDRK